MFMCEAFDYLDCVVNYNGQRYPFRYVWNDEYNQEILVSVLSLNHEVFEKNGNWPDTIAQYIDEKIAFYIEDSEITKSDEYLQMVLKNNLS